MFMVAKAALIIVCFAVIGLMSGCTMPGDSPFAEGCSSVGICQVEEKEPEILDVITIEGIEVRPEERIRPGTQVDVIVKLKNRDKNPINEVDIESIAIDNMGGIFSCVGAGETSSASGSSIGSDCMSICSSRGYSDGTCSSSPISGWSSVGSCGSDGTKTCYCNPSSGSSSGGSPTGSGSTGVKCEITGKSMFSGAENNFPFTIKASDNVGSTALTGTIQVSVKYKYKSTRTTTISYLPRDVYIDYKNSGKQIATSIVNMPSDGPVEAYIDISSLGQPILYDSGNIQPYNVFLSVMNKGQGEISSIAPQNLKLEFEGGSNTFTKCATEFGGDSCSGSSSSSGSSGGASGGAGTSSISNTEEIRIRGSGKEFKYYLEFKPASNLEFVNDAMATTKLITTVDYVYILRQKRDIKVSPNAEI